MRTLNLPTAEEVRRLTAKFGMQRTRPEPSAAVLDARERKRRWKRGETRKHDPAGKRAAVLALRSEGYTDIEIAAKLGIHKSYVSEVAKWQPSPRRGK